MSDTTTVSDDELMEAMRDVVDPELGINVVDLGLVYGVSVDDSNGATVDMTLTSAACPHTDVIEDQTRAASTAPVDDFHINWVDAAVGRTRSPTTAARCSAPSASTSSPELPPSLSALPPLLRTPFSTRRSKQRRRRSAQVAKVLQVARVGFAKPCSNQY
jgi:metal-sulfur cluster biosynthetic enzyme